MNLTVSEANEIISYNPKTGRAWHNKRDLRFFKSERSCKSWNSKNAGKEIKRTNRKGYIHVSVFGKLMELHRLIWFRQTGEWPNIIDHINGDKTDNRFENLRNVDFRQNSRNLKLSKRNTSGCIGVHFLKNRNKWEAQICDDSGKQVYLGVFNTKEEAIAARKAAEIKYGYHENHGTIR